MRHFRDAIVAVSACQVIFLIVSAWNINFSLTGIAEFMGMQVPSLKQISIALLAGITSLAITMVYLVNQLLKTTELETKLAVANISNELAQDSIRILRAQRHDFLNHLQVLAGYIQLGKNKAALTHLKQVNAELTDLRAVSSLNMPEVALLLFIKREEALKHGITIKYHIGTDLSDVRISQSDMMKIISHLLDNAIYELKANHQAVDSEKTIQVTLEKVGDTLFIKIQNSHGITNGENRIVEYGYRIQERNGQEGINTLKNLVEEKYGGKFEVLSGDGRGTSLTIAV